MARVCKKKSYLSVGNVAGKTVVERIISVPKNDKWFRQKTVSVINPFVDGQVTEFKGEKVISFGVSSYGYDVRLDTEFKYLKGPTLDPKELFDNNAIKVNYYAPFWLQAHSFILAQSFEKVKVPRDCIVLVLGKSTYARIGLIVNTTPLEPEWQGNITLELSNTSEHPIKVYPMEGIAQLVFFECSEVCNISYADKDGKYNNQVGVTLSRV